MPCGVTGAAAKRAVASPRHERRRGAQRYVTLGQRRSRVHHPTELGGGGVLTQRNERSTKKTLASRRGSVPLTRPRPARRQIRCGAGRWVTDNERVFADALGFGRAEDERRRASRIVGNERRTAHRDKARQKWTSFRGKRTNERVPIRTDPKLLAATHTQRSAFGRTWSCECSGEAHGSRGIARSLAGSSPGVDLRDGIAGKSGFTGDGRGDTRVASVCRWRSRTG